MQCRGAQSNEQVCKPRFLDKEGTAWFNTSSSEMIHRNPQNNTPTLVSQGHSVLLDRSMEARKTTGVRSPTLAPVLLIDAL